MPVFECGDARLVAGTAAPQLIAAMTAAFALGQLVGPLTLRADASGAASLVLPSAIAAAALVAGSIVLLVHRTVRPEPSPASTQGK